MNDSSSSFLTNVFSIFNLPIKFKIDQKLLTKSFYQLSRENHPDHSLGKSEKDGEKMSLINEAYETLKNDELRRDAVLAVLLSEELRTKKGNLPFDLAEQWFELSEQLSEEKAKNLETTQQEFTRFKADLNERIHKNIQLIDQLENEFDQNESERILKNLKEEALELLKKINECLLNQNVLMRLKKDVDGYFRD